MQKSKMRVVSMGRGGELIEIDDDVQSIARQIKDIDPRLGIEYNLQSMQFRVYETGEDGVRRTVMWVDELTGDIPNHLRRIQKTNYVLEMRRRDAQAEADRDHRLHERLGPVSEKLTHAIRKDLGFKPRIFVP